MTRSAVASLNAADAEEAVDQIAEALTAFAEGGPDREADCERLCTSFGLNPEGNRARWSDAKLKRQDASRHNAPSIEPDIEPDVALNGAVSPAKLVRRPKWAQDEVAVRQAHIQGLLANAKASTARSSTAAPTIEPEIESTAQSDLDSSAVGRVQLPAVIPQRPPPTEQPLILNREAPFDTAKEFVRRRCRKDGEVFVWFWQGQFWRWDGKYYIPDDKDHTEIRGQVYEFLDGAQRYGHKGPEPFQPKPSNVNDVIDGLKTGLGLGVECHPPMWLDARQPATQWIVFANGIVNVLTGEMRPLSSDMWAHSALGFDWRPDAPCPTWNRFLEDVFPDDGESQQFIEEWIGYCMTEETRFQKGAMLVGPKRSGKGTISHVLRQLVGDRSHIGLSFSNWSAGENSRQPLIGKRIGVFADVRLKPGRAYGSTSYDPGGIGHVSSELLLNIIGEDAVTIPRKYIGPWHGQLRLKLMLISNEVPNLNDASGVLPSRFIKVRFGVSFFNREDVTLRERLSDELSSIAARCVAAYQRLCERGRFIQPASADALDRDVLKASDPFAAMAIECFAPDPEESVVKVVAYNVFERWCRENGRLDVFHTTPNNAFGKKLQAVAGLERITSFQPHGQQRRWVGMRVRKPGRDSD